MRKPPRSIYLLGNSVSVVAIIGGSCLLGYEWWIGELQSAWVPIGAFFASGAAANANTKLTAYQAWEDSWDIMGGARPRRRSRMGVVVYLAIWVGIAVAVARLDYHQPLHVMALLSFAAATLLMLRQLFPRRARAARQQRPDKVAIVAVVPAVPRHSPSAAQASQALPIYCAGLLS